MAIIIIVGLVLIFLAVFNWYTAEKWKSRYELSQSQLRTTESLLKESHLTLSENLETCMKEYVEGFKLLKDTNDSLSQLWKCMRELLDTIQKTDSSHTKTTNAVIETIKELAKMIDNWDTRSTALIDLVTKDLSKKLIVKKKTSSSKNVTHEEDIFGE